MDEFSELAASYLHDLNGICPCYFFHSIVKIISISNAKVFLTLFFEILTLNMLFYSVELF